MTTNAERIAQLPKDPASLQRMVLQLQDTVASHETAKRQREQAAEIAAASPAAAFEMDVFNVKRELEGLADGSEADPTDPIARGQICRRATELLGRLLAALPKQ
jgi:hypothetical protein